MYYEHHDDDWRSKTASATYESVLAGLSEEERAAMVAEEMRIRTQRFDNYGLHSQVASWGEEADYFAGEDLIYYDKLLKPVPGDVPQSLDALLNMQDKRSLTDLASFLELDTSRLTNNKTDKLAAMLAREIPGLPIKLLSDRVMWFSSAYVRKLRRLLKTGGHILLQKDSANIAQEFLSPRAPFLFGFDQGEAIELVVPIEMRNPLSHIDWDEAISQLMTAESIEHFVVLHAQLRGIDTLDNVYAQWKEWREGLTPEEASASCVRATDFEKFCQITTHHAVTAGENYESVRTHEGLTYVIHSSFFGESNPGMAYGTTLRERMPKGWNESLRSCAGMGRTRMSRHRWRASLP